MVQLSSLRIQIASERMMSISINTIAKVMLSETVQGQGAARQPKERVRISMVFSMEGIMVVIMVVEGIIIREVVVQGILEVSIVMNSWCEGPASESWRVSMQIKLTRETKFSSSRRSLENARR